LKVALNNITLNPSEYFEAIFCNSSDLFYKIMQIVLFIVALQNVLKIKHMIRNKEVIVDPYYKDFHDEVIKSLTRLSPGDPYLKICRNNTQNKTNTGKQHDDFTQKHEKNPSTSPNSNGLRICSKDMGEIKEIDPGYDFPITTGGGPKQKEFVEDQNIPIGKGSGSFSKSTCHIYDEIDPPKPPVPTTPRPPGVRPETVTPGDEFTEKVRLEKGKIVLLQKNRFSNECKECRIDLNAVEECVIFNGGKGAVMDAKLKMYERLDDIVEVTQTVSKDLVSFLLSKLSWVKEILKRERVSVYITTKNDDLICCQAFSKPIAEKGLKLVLSNFDHVEVPYTEVHFKFLNSSDWKNLESNLTNDSEVVVDVVRKKKTIVISGKKSECRSAADKIKKNLCNHADAKSQKIEIKGSKSVCFHHVHQKEIKKLENEMR